jgi:hypothetical protein
MPRPAPLPGTPEGQEAVVQGGLKGSGNLLCPLPEQPGAGGSRSLQGAQEVRQLGRQGEDGHGAEKGGHGVRVEQSVEASPDVAAVRPALQEVWQHAAERGSEGVVRAVSPGRRRSVLQPLVTQRHGPGREEQDHHAALLQGLTPLRVEPGQGPLRAQLTTAPQIHGHAQWQPAQRRRQRTHQALEARAIGRVKEQSRAATGCRCGRGERGEPGMSRPGPPLTSPRLR